ncbi:MAG: Mov34/MPN/PAD-1 family protein [Candidatus Rokubacteria bacterium]|nr:Mov34/MPN/PAD-1 family protein [Candidatus Rokubacteria bacterium]
MIVTADELAVIRRQAEAEYPHECCGVILVKASRNDERVLLPCRNIQSELHAKDPLRHPRDARTAYYMAPQDLLTVMRLESDGFGVRTIYHSHIDAGAYFSETDKRQAAAGGQPLYADATYLVVSVVNGKVVEASAFGWDPARRDFLPVSLEAS